MALKTAIWAKSIPMDSFIFEGCQRCQIDSPGERHFQFLCTPGTARAAAVLASCPCFPSKPPRSGEGPPRRSIELSPYYLELFLCSQPVSSLLCYSQWKHHPRQMCFCEEHLSAENRNGNQTHLCASHQMSRRSQQLCSHYQGGMTWQQQP